MICRRLNLLSIGIFFSVRMCAQDDIISGDTTSATPLISSKYITQVSVSAGKLEQKLHKESGKILSNMQQQEDRIRRKLAKKDSLKAATIFAGSKLQYEKFQQVLEKGYMPAQYIANLDTMSGSLNFLQMNPSLIMIHGTQKADFYLNNFTINPTTGAFYAEFTVNLFDDFGLELSDVTKFMKKRIIGMFKVPDLDGLKAWYILQHQRGYKAFVTRISSTFSVSGSIK